MLYTFDLRKLLRRYSPVWFRWQENQSLAYALCRRLGTLDVWFGRLRNDVVKEWQYNGLYHSLEWALNDKFDSVQRRIWLTLPDHIDYTFFGSIEDAPIDYFEDVADPLAHSFFDAADLANAVLYPFEFDINVPDVLGIAPTAVFAHVDLYRFAGRRPRVIIRGPFNAIYGIHYYQDYNG